MGVRFRRKEAQGAMRDVIFIRRSSKKAIEREKAKYAGKDVDFFVIKKKKAGESERQYYSRIYKSNRKFFKRQGEGRAFAAPDSGTAFRMESEARKALRNLSPEEAVKNAVRSRWMSGEEVARSNAIEALREKVMPSGKTAWKEFREMTKVKGRYAKFDVSKLGYDQLQGVYTYGDVRFGWRYKKGEGTKFEMWRVGS